MKKFSVLQSIKIGKKEYGSGDTVELDAQQAVKFVERGLVSETLEAAKPAAETAATKPAAETAATKPAAETAAVKSSDGL